jgi:hypothetical protein
MNALLMDNTPKNMAAACPLLLTFQTAALFPGGSRSRLLRSTLTGWRDIDFLFAESDLHPLMGTFSRALREALCSVL